MKTARCPITGQVGVCPSQASAASSTEPSSDLSPRDQQAHVWQSLMEHNLQHQFATKRVDGDDGCPPGLMHASTKSFTPSEDGSLDSGSEMDSLEFSPSAAKPQQQERSWPTYDQVSARVMTADYKDILTNPTDMHNPNTTKLFCPHGVVCQARLEFFDAPNGVQPYTGLLAPGTTADHCLVRLSSAVRPVDQGTKNPIAQAIARRTFGAKLCASNILPAAAIKLFRGNGVASGNILLLGSKVGQPERNFFQHALCTAVTEKIPAMTIPFLRRFSRYSDYPLSLGLSELCQYNAQGHATPDDQVNFPFALCLQPVVQIPALEDIANNSDSDRPFDAFIDDIQQHVPAGTHLFDIYVAPTPESVGKSKQCQRIGRVMSTSSFLYSSPTDGLTFRHQSKEDDLALRRDWEERMHSTTVRCQDGTQGTVAKLTGWQIFEDHIRVNADYVDFEKQRKAPKAVSFQDDDHHDDVSIPGWTFCGFRKARVEV
ncbi:expressed unknown protein [Seminavis robusta]|uniref:Uncharacterized protein n=1 Tax=Seminavis robusta TaxID=568900 RepID=A0A9N8EAP7_9STRA|nr:expressed unknown protein [Seminavis robusta]|eukprot:Sro815_g206500.1 n/a (486) ;mRNA; f:23157-24614